MSVFIDNEMLHDEMEAFIKERCDHSDAYDLNPIQLYILASLYEHDVQRASDLASQVGRAATSFTPILDKLEVSGYVRREMHPSDRRAVNIILTPKGDSVRSTVASIIAAVEKEFKGKK